MGTTIDNLQINIAASATQASNGLTRLQQTLNSFRAATRGGLGLDGVLGQISSVNAELRDLSARMTNTVLGMNSLNAAFRNGVNMAGNFLNQLTATTAGLQAAAAQLNTLPTRMTDAANSMNRLNMSLRNGANSSGSFLRRLIATAVGLRAAVKTVGGWISSTNEYIENMNLFQVSMGRYAEEAQNYADKVGELMGIDPGVWMRNQGIFQTLATGFGVAGDRAYVMSQNLTQLGYDLSSFFNIAVEGETGTMNKLRSAISGELEPLRRLGFDLSQAKLEAVALSLGIDQTFKSMSQAQKAQLRYYAIMTQVTTAQGDMARTLNAPANQLRVLQAAATQAARALGSIFIPALNAILPYAIAATNVVRTLASAIANLFGFKMPEVDYSGVSSGLGEISDGLDDVGSSAGGASKKMKDLLADWDELNIIQSQSGGGGGGGGSAGGIGDNWTWDLPTYDFLQGLVSGKAQQIFESWKPIVDYLMEHAGGLLNLVESIGAGILAWRISNSLFPSLSTTAGWLQSLLAISLDLAVITVSATLNWKFANNFLETGDGFTILSQALTDLFGGLLVGEVTRAATSSAAAGNAAAGISFLVNAAVTFKAVYDHVSKEGWSDQALLEDIVGAINAGIGSGLLVASLGAGTGAAVATGITIAITTGFVLKLVSVEANKDYTFWSSFFGTMRKTKDELQKLVEDSITVNASQIITLSNPVIQNWEDAKTKVDEAAIRLQGEASKIALGITVDDSEGALTAFKTDLETNFLPALKAKLDAAVDVVGLYATIIGLVDGNGNATDAATLATSLIAANDMVYSYAREVGVSIGEMLADGIQAGEEVAIANQADLLTRLSTAGKVRVERDRFEQSLNLSDLDELDFESFLNLVSTFLTERSALAETFRETAQANREAQLETLGIYEEYVRQQQEANPNYAVPEAVQNAIDQLTAATSGTVEQQVNYLVDQATSATLDLIKESFANSVGEAMDSPQFRIKLDEKGYVAEDLRSQLADLGTETTDLPLLVQRLWMQMWYETLGKTGADQALGTAKMLGMNPWDMMSSSAQNDFATYLLSYLNGKGWRPDVLNKRLPGIFESFGWNAGALDFDQSTVINDTEQALQDLRDGASQATESLNKVAETTPVADLVSQLPAGELPVTTTLEPDWAGTAANGIAEKVGVGSLFIPVSLGQGFASGQIAATRYGDKLFSRRAGGGFISEGEMFIAREAGPELVGRIGRRTAVANDEQIISGIEAGVASGQAEQNSLLRQQNDYLRRLVSKEFIAKVVPSTALARVNRQSEAMRLRTEG